MQSDTVAKLVGPSVLVGRRAAADSPAAALARLCEPPVPEITTRSAGRRASGTSLQTVARAARDESDVELEIRCRCPFPDPAGVESFKCRDSVPTRTTDVRLDNFVRVTMNVDDTWSAMRKVPIAAHFSGPLKVQASKETPVANPPDRMLSEARDAPDSSRRVKERLSYTWTTRPEWRLDWTRVLDCATGMAVWEAEFEYEGDADRVTDRYLADVMRDVRGVLDLLS